MSSVFISWSGELSSKLAEELRKWIPAVLQFARPYFTPNDIEKGAKWSTEISKRLSESQIGIICLTRENFERPWILFEAGALSKGVDGSRICSLLFNIDPADLSGPLTTFQATKFEKADFKKLMATINDAGGEAKLTREVFDEVFDMWWPRLEASVSKILDSAKPERSGELRSDRDILEEILSLSRITTRRTPDPQGRQNLPMGFIAAMLATTERLLGEAEVFRDRDIFKCTEEFYEHCDYLMKRQVTTSRDLIEQLERIKFRLLELELHINERRKNENDDAIPF